MKKNFKSAIKCLLMNICLAGLGAFMFASIGYADGAASIVSTESEIGDGYHKSTGYNSSNAYDHGTTEWQELRDTSGPGDSGISWSYSNDGGVSWSEYGHDALYVGQHIKVQSIMFSDNIGNHYANVLKAWFAPEGHKFDDSNEVASGFKVIRGTDGDDASPGYTFDSGHQITDGWLQYGDTYYEWDRYTINNRDNKGYGNDTYTVLSEEIEITEEYLGTAYLSARVTCSDSLSQSVLGYYDWNAQWGIETDKYLAAFDAYSYYDQGEIETWAITVKSGLSGGGVNPVPEPATLVLFGMGLIGLARVGRKKA